MLAGLCSSSVPMVMVAAGAVIIFKVDAVANLLASPFSRCTFKLCLQMIIW
jgi:hypothetical protein